MTIAQNKKEAFRHLMEQFSDVLSNNGCNDYAVANTPELYLAVEEANADNYRLSVEDWKKHEDYYPPQVSGDKKTIYTQDYMILSMIRKELGL